MAGTARNLRARGIRARPLPRIRPRRGELPRVPGAAQLPEVRGARDRDAGRAGVQPARRSPTRPTRTRSSTKTRRRSPSTAMRRPARSARKSCTRTAAAPRISSSLDRMGIDLKGKIVLMRYSNPYSYRGYKVFEAERRGAAGTIIYSDPAEDGSRMGTVYPERPLGPGLAHPVGRDPLRLARPGRAVHLSLEAAGGRHAGRKGRCATSSCRRFRRCRSTSATPPRS